MGERIIEIAHATVRRQGRPILDDVSFSVTRGEHVAIIGPNGAGKSTLVQVISEEIHPLYNPLSKRILFGQPRWQVLELRKQLGIVSQSLQYLCNSTYKAWEIVASGFFSSIGLDFHHQVTEGQLLKVEATMKTYGVWPLEEKQMNRLSSGEARRVLLCRASVHDPQVMLLDEAGANLDFPSRHLYRSSLEQLDREGKTLILATHELSEIIPAIARVVVMSKGKIVADGPKEEIIREDVLSAVYGSKVFIDKREGLFTAWC
ncbi:ATP-binding cassette domain-containing protein [Sphaerochaeta sp. PS]|uniref:ABC transporter ATP-binding protein n=1 Tax=Sphaerochaeta sp. PS TaxID=3076336 RepID=UPI0028A53C97|nr:ATP-binding cassette domain-containing protein [Sphaerochaeta sp. PS]MDT4763014.1 ATP-binding cassette domain-containing protein [Sphaerochaeta sp. PS]